jgi:hypothetical protein
MQRTTKIAVGVGVLIVAVGAGVLFTGIFAGFNNPEFHRSLLRLLAVLGLGSVLAMCVAMLGRFQPVEPAVVSTKRRARRIR